MSSVAVPKLLISDPDPACQVNTYPDPTCWVISDPDLDLDPSLQVVLDPDPCPRNYHEIFVFKVGIHIKKIEICAKI